MAVQAIAVEHGGEDFRWAADEHERAKLWSARHAAYFACLQLYPGSRALTADVCVPLSRLTQCIVDTQEDVAERGIPTPILGHVGDGNFHVVFLVNPDNPAEVEEARQLNRRLVQRALEMEGTCTGEHGVGLGKRDYLVEELGEAVDLMRDIKRLFDPGNLMNPGKVLADRD